MIIAIGLEREEASAAMEFEKAAALHAQWQKVKAAQALADGSSAPSPNCRQSSFRRRPSETDAHGTKRPSSSSNGGCIIGPERLSTLGVRAVREQTSVGSSLFAQPLMLQAVPLEGEPTASDSPENRAAYVLSLLEKRAEPSSDLALLSDHLSLLRRWYYRPEKQRNGEIFFPNEDGGDKGAGPSADPARRRPHGPRRSEAHGRNPARQPPKKLQKESKPRSSTKAAPTSKESSPFCRRIVKAGPEDDRLEVACKLVRIEDVASMQECSGRTIVSMYPFLFQGAARCLKM